MSSNDASDSDDESDGVDIHDLLRDHFGPQNTEAWVASEYEDNLKEEPNNDAIEFYKLLNHFEQSLYPNCKFSKLSFLMKLFHIKCFGGWSNKSFTMLLQLLNDAFP